MLDFAKRALQELTESVVRPAWAWVMSRSWPIRFGFLLFALAGAGAGSRPDLAMQAASDGMAFVQAASMEEAAVPLTGELHGIVAETEGRLTKTVLSDLRQLGRSPVTPWPAAQAVVGLPETAKKRVNPENVVQFIRASQLADCFCWAEEPNNPGAGAGLFISGWVMSAFADLKEPLSAEEIDAVLLAQSARGWWPIFLEAHAEQHASTYSTAWNVFGLVRQREERLIPAEKREAVDEAIERGVSWLLTTRSGAARWKPYPNLASSRESESISGLVMHVLHRAQVENMTGLDRDWLINLPRREMNASDMESPYVEIVTEEGTKFDHFQQVKVPWMLAATRDAFESGTLVQKGRAIRWIERIVASDSVRSADGNPNNWWRAELLYGLRQVKRGTGSKTAAGTS